MTAPTTGAKYPSPVPSGFLRLCSSSESGGLEEPEARVHTLRRRDEAEQPAHG